jgi:hypothetical protein
MHTPETRRGGPPATPSDTHSTTQHRSTLHFDSSQEDDLEPDLFGPQSFYPEAPASRENASSRLAAERIAPSVKDCRAEVLATFIQRGPATADEVAERLGRHVLMVRPRCSELVKLGLLISTGERRPSSRRMSSTVWRAAAGTP